MEKAPGMITMEARVDDPAAFPVLQALLEFDGQQRRRLFRDLHIRGEDPKDLKRAYTTIITARHFNALLYSVKATIAALTELQKEDIATKAGKLKSAAAWIAKKKQRVKELSASIKALSTFKAAKQKAVAAGKRLKIPKKLRPLSLATMTAERAQLRAKLHHKTRYVMSAERKLTTLKDREKLSVCFGSKKLFRAQFHLAENGYTSHEQWAEAFAFARSASTAFIGSKDETAGNQTAQVDAAAGTLSLRLPKTAEFAGHADNRLVIQGLRFPDKYLPHLLAAQGRLGPDASGQVQSAVQVRLVKRKKCGGNKTALYVQVTCQRQAVAVVTSPARGAIGVDLNADHLAICETDRFGNYLRRESLAFALKKLSTNQAEAVLGDYVAAIVGMAKAAGKPLVIERLDFRQKKMTLREQGPGYARMLSQLVYAKFHELMHSRTAAEGVGLILVNPAYSSVIGAHKFYGLEISSHEKAALVLARRALGFSERTKVFHGTRKPPARMAADNGDFPAGRRPRKKLSRRARHIWSLWARKAKAIRQGLVRGTKRRPRVSVAFGESSYQHPLVAKAARVMSLAEARKRQEDLRTVARARGDAACPPAMDLNVQVSIGL